jgi:hypothetical protein
MTDPSPSPTADDGRRTFTFTATGTVLVSIEARDEQAARRAYEQTTNGKMFRIDYTTPQGHNLDDLALHDATPELYTVDGEELIELCPRRDCGGHLVHDRCTDADCPNNTPHGRILGFPLPEVLAAAEHAAAATTHRECVEETEHPAHLCWTKNNGTSLASNGHDPDTTHTVYAIGWGPGTEPRLGDDDGPHHAIDLLTPNDDGSTLLDTLRTATESGHTCFFLHLTHDATRMTLTTTTD